MSTLLQDLHYALRILLKNAGYSLIAIITLAVGIGANTAIFSEVDAVLLRPLAYPNAEHLVMVWGSNPKAQQGFDELPIFGADFTEYLERNQSFDQMAGFRYARYNVLSQGYPEQVDAANVSANFLSILGVEPMLGRNFLQEEDQPGKNDVIILSYELWTRLTGSDPNIVGKTILLNGQKRNVVGVMPRGFEFPRASEMPPCLQFPKRTELWAPLALNPTERRTHGTRTLAVLAHLKPKLTLAQSQSDMDNISRQLQEKYPDSNAGLGLHIIPFREQLVGRVRPFLLVLWGAVGFVLLIACANVSNLQLARAAARQQEIVVRTALGATRIRIIRQLLTEGIVLALIGGALGLALAEVGIRLILAMKPSNLVTSAQAHIDGSILAFTLGASLLAGLLSAFTPALNISAFGLHQSLKESTHGSWRARGSLLVTEVALAVMLLVGTGLMIKSLLRLQAIDPGFNPENVLTMEFLLPGPQYNEDIQLVRFYQRAMDNIRSLPGVKAVSVVGTPPLSGQKLTSKFTIEGRPINASGEQPLANIQLISPEYFQTMGIPLLRGRSFTEHDNADSAEVAVVSQTMAKRFWPGTNAEGQRIKIGGTDDPTPWIQIVGVVADVKNSALNAEPKPELYLDYAQNISRVMHIAVRTVDDPLKLASSIRQQIWSMDKNQPVANIEAMKQVVADSVAGPRFTVVLLTVFSGVAFFLALLGVYGVISCFVSQRTREIGIRKALGAQTGDVLRLVIRQGVLLALGGIIIGLVAAFVLTRVLSSLLFEVSPTDPLVFFGIAASFLIVSIIASSVPAARAAAVDPIQALRHE